MRAIGLIAAVGALVGSAPAFAQQPPSLMNRLEKYCVATKGDADAARRAARADGFVTPPMELIPDLPRDIDDVEVVWTVFDGGVAMLMTGVANDPSIGMKGDFCAVASMPSNLAAVRDIESWLGAKLPAKQPYVMYAEEGSSRRVLKEDDSRGILTAVRDDKLRMAGAMNDKQMTLLMLVVLRL